MPFTIVKFLSKRYSVLRWYLLFRLGEEWKEPIHGDALLESRELIADESDEEDDEELEDEELIWNEIDATKGNSFQESS